MVRASGFGLAVALVAAGPALAAPPPTRLDPATIDARHRCGIWQGQAVSPITSDSPLVRTTRGVSRRGPLLTVRGETFRDVRGEQEMDTVRYYYAGPLTAVAADVVIQAPYEGQQAILVHRTAHDSVVMIGLPVASPDGRLLAAQGTDPSFGQWGVQIVEWTPQGFTPVARFTTVSRPCELRWTSSARLEFRTSGVGPETGDTWRPAAVERRNGRWVVIGPDEGQVTPSE